MFGKVHVEETARTNLPNLTTSNEVDEAEIDIAFQVCVNIIDNPPEEYKIVKQAVLGIVHLTAHRDDLRAQGMLKILQVVKDASKYRSNPRRYAVHSLASMTYYDEKLIVPCIQLFTQLIKPSSENSQYVRKAAFVALSRIGRRYPKFQDVLIPIFLEYYRNPKTKESVLWGIIIGLGRISQSNALLRSQFALEWIKRCAHKSFRLRWAGIKGLGHACCPIGDVIYDSDLAQQCFEIANGFLSHGGVEALKVKLEANPNCESELEDNWKEEAVYLVQYAATQALGLLLRSNPDMWWDKISPIFGKLLLNSHIASMIKAMVLITYGKIAYYLEPLNPYYKSIFDLLSNLSQNENVLVAEPATYGLVNFALAHNEYYHEIKQLVASKLKLPVEKAGKEELQYYLKTWCKIIARDYQPILNMCSKVISVYSVQTIASYTDSSFGTQTDEDRRMDQKDLNKSERKNNQFENVFPNNNNNIDPDKEINSITDSFINGKNSVEYTPCYDENEVKRICSEKRLIFDVCSQFSYPVLESVFLLLEDISVLDDRAFLDNLKKMIIVYSGKLDKSEINQKGLIELIDKVNALEPHLKEYAICILNYPQVLDDSFWLSHLKLVLSARQGLISDKNQKKMVDTNSGLLNTTSFIPPSSQSGFLCENFGSQIDRNNVNYPVNNFSVNSNYSHKTSINSEVTYPAVIDNNNSNIPPNHPNNHYVNNVNNKIYINSNFGNTTDYNSNNNNNNNNNNYSNNNNNINIENPRNFSYKNTVNKKFATPYGADQNGHNKSRANNIRPNVFPSFPNEANTNQLDWNNYEKVFGFGLDNFVQDHLQSFLLEHPGSEKMFQDPDLMIQLQNAPNQQAAINIIMSYQNNINRQIPYNNQFNKPQLQFNMQHPQNYVLHAQRNQYRDHPPLISNQGPYGPRSSIPPPRNYDIGNTTGNNYLNAFHQNNNPNYSQPNQFYNTAVRQNDYNIGPRTDIPFQATPSIHNQNEYMNLQPPPPAALPPYNHRFDPIPNAYNQPIDQHQQQQQQQQHHQYNQNLISRNQHPNKNQQYTKKVGPYDQKNDGNPKVHSLAYQKNPQFPPDFNIPVLPNDIQYAASKEQSNFPSYHQSVEQSNFGPSVQPPPAFMLIPPSVAPLLPQNKVNYHPVTNPPLANGIFLYNRFPEIDEEDAPKLYLAYIKAAKYGEYCGLFAPLLKLIDFHALEEAHENLIDVPMQN